MAQAENTNEAAPKRRAPRRRLVLLLVAAVLVVGAAGAGALVYLRGMPAIPGFARPNRAVAAASGKPVDVDVPELTVSLPNHGQPRQLRIHLTLELATTPDPAHPVLTPRLYDALVTYLRTLTDADLDGGLALERLRGDLFRRVDLVLGPGVLRGVLITGLLIA